MHTPHNYRKPGLPSPSEALSAVNDAQEWLSEVLGGTNTLPETRHDAHAAYRDALDEYLLTVPGREEYAKEVRRRALLGEPVEQQLLRLRQFRLIAQERQRIGIRVAAEWREQEVEAWDAPFQALIASVQSSAAPDREVRQLRYFLRKERDTRAHDIASLANQGVGADDPAQMDLIHSLRRTEYLYSKFDEWEERNLRGERDEESEEP